MTNTLRKIALQITIPVLWGLIVLNAYLVSKNLKLIQKNTTQRVEASEMQAGISDVAFDLQDMETGQRGYLLTGDPSYLKPYSEANGRLAVHFANLRSRLMGKAPQDRSLETQLESVAESKIAEMKETIRLRELGYRHRAFLIVSSNRGKDLMDEARTTLDALSLAQTRNVARYDREMSESVGRAVKESAFASCILLFVTVVTFLAFNRYRKRLEVGYARHAEELQATSLQLEQFTSTIFHDFRALVEQMRSYANTLLDVYGGFLPRQGQEKAERIEDGAGQMISLLDDLSKNSPSGNSDNVVDVRPLPRLSA
jgi:CHASE3 domain sensor protein